MKSIRKLLLDGYRLLSPYEIIVGEARRLGDFCIPINQKLTIGTRLDQLKELNGYADTFFKIERVTCNSPCEGFVYFSELKASNIHLTLRTGLIDSFDYSSVAHRQQLLSLNHVIPAGSHVSVFGHYSGFVPKDMVQGYQFDFNVTFYGTAYSFTRV